MRPGMADGVFIQSGNLMSLPTAHLPLARPTAPAVPLPEHACDSHVHMVADDPAFPPWSGRVENPAAGCFEDWMERFRAHQRQLGLQRIVFVHSIVFGADNRITLEAVKAWGTDQARAIVLVHDDVDDAELDRLATEHAMGVRLNYVHGGILSFDGVKAMACRLKERGMHIQMLINSHRHMAEIADDIRRLPVPVVFDHLGWPDLAAGIDEPGMQTMLSLIGDGHAYVKLSGAYRLCPPPYDQAAPFIEAMVSANPEGGLWGTDWPHIMLGDAKTPDSGELLNALLDAVPNSHDRQKIFVDNPSKLYRFD